MDFEKVLQEKIPLHARFYGWYVPENGRNYEWPPKEDLQEEIDDMSEDDDTNGRKEYDNGKAYVPEIRRAIKNEDEEKEFESEFEEIEYFSAVDEQHCILGQKGCIIQTTIWSCLCVDSKHGICTCPGTAMGTFQAEEKDNAEDTKDEPVNYTCYPTATYNEDGFEGDLKRAKVRQPRQICSTKEEATTGDEDSK